MRSRESPGFILEKAANSLRTEATCPAHGSDMPGG
jgi:hypothetical protein